jgi:TPR repeat protein
MKKNSRTSYFLAAVMLLLTIGLLAQSDNLFNEGKALFKQKKWAEACSKFEAITKNSSDTDEVWYAIGLCKIKLDDGNGARKALSRISDKRMDLKQKLAKYLKATASKRLSKIPIPPPPKNGSINKKPSKRPETRQLPDDPICKANRKVVAGAITMYSMDNEVKGQLPADIFELLQTQHLLQKPPECPNEGIFSIFQKGSDVRVECSLHGSDDESCISLYKTEISMQEEVKVAEKAGIKPVVKVVEGSLRDIPLSELQELAEGGSVKAQIELAQRYHGGRRGAKKDEQQAQTWLEKAASQGDSEGMAELGFFLWSKDKDQARTWLEKAALENNKASHFLGNQHNIEYLSNPSLKNEKEEARKWYALGAERNHPPSMFKLFKIDYPYSSTWKIEETEPLKQAAMAGYPEAMKKYAEVIGYIAGMQQNDDLMAESLAWHRLYIKFEKSSYEKENAEKFLKTIELGASEEAKASGKELAAELGSQISEYNED